MCFQQSYKGLLAALNTQQEKTSRLTPRFRLEIAFSNLSCSGANRRDYKKEETSEPKKAYFKNNGVFTPFCEVNLDVNIPLGFLHPTTDTGE